MGTIVCPRCGKAIEKEDEIAFVCPECGSIVLVEGEEPAEPEETIVKPLPNPDPDAMALPAREDPKPAPEPDYGIEPVIDLEQGLVLYGIYPQKKVGDPKLLKELDSLVEPTENGWYFHKGKFYAKGRSWFLCSPILWRIASKKQGWILLVANSILDLRPFQEIGGDPIYETSSLREWLNGEFLSKAFCLDSSKLLPASGLEEDRVFLLSVDEYSNPDFDFDPSPMEEDPNRGAIPSEYVKSKGTVLSFFTSSKGTRMEGAIRCFKINGTLAEIPATSLGGVRPAIWIEAE